MIGNSHSIHAIHLCYIFHAWHLIGGYIWTFIEYIVYTRNITLLYMVICVWKANPVCGWSRLTMPSLYPLFYENLRDNIPSVRQGAAVALVNVVRAYGKVIATETMVTAFWAWQSQQGASSLGFYQAKIEHSDWLKNFTRDLSKFLCFQERFRTACIPFMISFIMPAKALFMLEQFYCMV